MQRTETRRARKEHRCERCLGTILPGELHLFVVISPDHEDIGNPSWWDLRECASCAKACGRPVTVDTAQSRV